MLINVLESGSLGNCTILTDKNNNQLILDCGIIYKNISKKINDFMKLDGVLITHEHSDHKKSMSKFEDCGIDVFSPMHNNVKANEMIYLNNWKILPMKLSHNVECFGYVVVSNVENKKFVYITDTTFIPKLKLNTIDCLMIEVNYDKNVIDEYINDGKELRSFGYMNHLEMSQVKDYFIDSGEKPKKLIIAHLSNSGYINDDILLETMKPFAEEVYLANLKDLVLRV